jgi:hypothetical protein
MIAAAHRRNGLVLLAGLALLAGCSFEMPSFLGREGGGDSFYQLRGEPPPPPRGVPIRQAALERGLHGVILRVAGEAPTQGYWGAQLRPLNDGAPDAAGVLSFELLAIPPASPQAVGAQRTRVVTAAVFVPNKALEDLRGFRVAGAGAVETLPLR